MKHTFAVINHHTSEILYEGNREMFSLITEKEAGLFVYFWMKGGSEEDVMKESSVLSGLTPIAMIKAIKRLLV